MRRIERLFEPDAIDSYVKSAEKNGGRADIVIDAYYEWTSGSNSSMYHCRMSMKTGEAVADLYRNYRLRNSNHSRTFKDIYEIDKEAVLNAIWLAETLKGRGIEVTVSGKPIGDAEGMIEHYTNYISGLKNSDHTRETAAEIGNKILDIKKGIIVFTNTVKVMNLNSGEVGALPVEYLHGNIGEKFEGASEQDIENK